MIHDYATGTTDFCTNEHQAELLEKDDVILKVEQMGWLQLASFNNSWEMVVERSTSKVHKTAEWMRIIIIKIFKSRKRKV